MSACLRPAALHQASADTTPTFRTYSRPSVRRNTSRRMPLKIGIPIGSKIVFEKWGDESGNAFIGINHVYQTVDQLRGVTMLNLNTPPNIIPLQLEDMTPNEDGLYPFSQMLDRSSESHKKN